MKQSYSYTYACLHINTLSHVQIYKSTNILVIFPILIPYTLNVFSAQPPAPSRNGGGLLSVMALHIVPVTSLHAASRNGGGLLAVTALHIVPFTPLQARNGGSPTVGHGPSHRACHVTPSTEWRESYCRSRPFTSCLSRHSKHGMAGVLLSVTVLHIVPVTSLQAAWKVTTLQTVGWQRDGKRGADWCWWQMQKGIYCWPSEPSSISSSSSG